MSTIVRFNHEDDTYDVMRTVQDLSSINDPGIERVERILGERKECRNHNAIRFLNDLQRKKH